MSLSHSNMQVCILDVKKRKPPKRRGHHIIDGFHFDLLDQHKEMSGLQVLDQANSSCSGTTNSGSRIMEQGRSTGLKTSKDDPLP